MEDLQKEIEEILKGLEERIHEPPLQVKGQWVCKELPKQNQRHDCIQRMRIILSNYSVVYQSMQGGTTRCFAGNHQHLDRSPQITTQSCINL